MNFAEAFATVGIALAIAIAFLGFFWMLTTGMDGPNDYNRCLNTCTDGWGRVENLECLEMCLPLSDNYKPVFHHKYWYNNGTGRDLDDIDPDILNDTINHFKNQMIWQAYYPPSCYTNQEDFLDQFPNQTMPVIINYYAIYCHEEKWWKEVWEQ